MNSKKAVNKEGFNKTEIRIELEMFQALRNSLPEIYEGMLHFATSLHVHYLLCSFLAPMKERPFSVRAFAVLLTALCLPR